MSARSFYSRRRSTNGIALDDPATEIESAGFNEESSRKCPPSFIHGAGMSPSLGKTVQATGSYGL
jgi:hypothetical protein